MPSGRIAALVVLLSVIAQGTARADNGAGGTINPGSGGNAAISVWVIGAVNGGVSKPSGTTSCTPWTLFDGSMFGTPVGQATVINSATGEVMNVYVRTCGGINQYVFVAPRPPEDIAKVAYQNVAALVPKPKVSFSPPVDKMIVNFETWLGVTPSDPVTATAAIPGLSATVTATATDIEWTTGSQVDGDTTTINCLPWGSTKFAADGCTWTPAYPSVAKVTGTTDQRYHGTVTIVWHVTWVATNGATSSLGDLRTTTPIEMGVQEIQTIGG